MPTAQKLEIEVVLALAEQQELRTLAVPVGTSVGHAIDLSAIGESFPELSLDSLTVGIWGKVVDRSRQVQEGDRVEIYRPLPVDPRLARRKIAVEGGFMGKYKADADKR